jgi:hypothetical protein
MEYGAVLLLFVAVAFTVGLFGLILVAWLLS